MANHQILWSPSPPKGNHLVPVHTLTAIKRRALTMPPNFVPPIESSISSSPPICDDEANIGGGEANAV